MFGVHVRNIKGYFQHFKEPFPDNRDVSFVRAIRTYKEVGYDEMVMPDVCLKLRVTGRPPGTRVPLRYIQRAPNSKS